jgi:hypothetical protein
MSHRRYAGITLHCSAVQWFFFGRVSVFSAVFVCSYQALAATSRWVDKADNPYHCTDHSYDKQNAC